MLIHIHEQINSICADEASTEQINSNYVNIIICIHSHDTCYTVYIDI